MNIAYFRKSNFPINETVKKVEELTSKNGWQKLGTTKIGASGTMIMLCRPEWVNTILETNQNLLGFLPCSISVFQKGNDVLVGSGQPAIMKALTQNPNINKLANDAEEAIKSIIHEAAGVGELKPTGVKLYSTMSCPYCKMEKSWLENKQVKHDVVYVDLNQEEAQKMVDKTGQMGVPVTEVQYEDAESEYIIGFDRPKLASLLGVSE